MAGTLAIPTEQTRLAQLRQRVAALERRSGYGRQAERVSRSDEVTPGQGYWHGLIDITVEVPADAWVALAAGAATRIPPTWSFTEFVHMKYTVAEITDPNDATYLGTVAPQFIYTYRAGGPAWAGIAMQQPAWNGAGFDDDQWTQVYLESHPVDTHGHVQRSGEPAIYRPYTSGQRTYRLAVWMDRTATNDQGYVSSCWLEVEVR